MKATTVICTVIIFSVIIQTIRTQNVTSNEMDRRVLNCQSTLILGLLYNNFCYRWYRFSATQLSQSGQQFYHLVTMPGSRACQNYAPGTVTYGGVSANNSVIIVACTALANLLLSNNETCSDYYRFYNQNLTSTEFGAEILAKNSNPGSCEPTPNVPECALEQGFQCPSSQVAGGG